MACDQYTPSSWFLPNSSQSDFTSNFTLGSYNWPLISWWGGTPYLLNQKQNWRLLLGWSSDNNAESALSNGHSKEMTTGTGMSSSFSPLTLASSVFKIDLYHSRGVGLYLRLRRESKLGDAEWRHVRLYCASVVVGDGRHRYIVKSKVQDLRYESDRPRSDHHQDQSRLPVATFHCFINFKQCIDYREPK